MDKLIVTQRYINDDSIFVSRGQLIANKDAACEKQWCNDVLNVGAVIPPGGTFEHVHPWWDSKTKTFTAFWYSTDSAAAVELQNKLLSPERIEKYRQGGWDVTSPVVIEHGVSPASKKEKLLSKIDVFETTGPRTIQEADGTYKYDGTTIEFWDNDGTVAYLTNSEIEYWLWTYMIQKHGNISLRFAIQDWCENVPHNRFNFYHEMHGPNNEIGISFTDDNPTVDEAFIKEYIDEIHNTIPHMKKMRPDYVTWPKSPITLDHRRRDSYGYYYMFYTNWGLDSAQWTNMQVAYLETFLYSIAYNGDLNSILNYAREKWTI